MYRINLYQERSQRASQARRRVGSTAVVAALGGMGLVAAGLLFVNGWILRERNRSFESEIARLTEEVRRRQPGPEVNMADQLAQLRGTRLLWAPKLAAVARSIGPSLRLLELTAQSQSKGQPAELEMVGVGRRAGADEVVAFLGTLRADPDISRDFPLIVLGQLEEDGSGRFQITCQPAGGAK